MGPDYQCKLGPTPESSNTSDTGCSGKVIGWTKTPTCLVTGTSNITVGAQLSGSSPVVSKAFNGAMEEIFIQRISLENITAHLFACPACGCNNFYLWDYTNPAARAYWANSTADLFNELGAEVCQWDGAEFQPTIAGWGMNHSNQTWDGPTTLWNGATQQAFIQSKALWKQELAVEMSMSFGGLGQWHGDMTPFSDEQNIKGGLCTGGNAWHRQMLVNIVELGLLYNAYNTPVETFHNLTEVDCFLGGLIATGIPPQMAFGSGSPAGTALLPRVKFWNDNFRRFGMTTESSVAILHYDDTFLVGLSGGTQAGDIRGYFAGNSSVAAAFPPDLADNATVLVFCSFAIPGCTNPGGCMSHTNISFGSPTHKNFTLFAASRVTVHMSGGFWQLAASQQVTETRVGVDGTRSAPTVVFPAGSRRSSAHSVRLEVGQYAVYAKSGGGEPGSQPQPAVRSA